jgi:transcriptional regulator with XRE-family HTH domain
MADVGPIPWIYGQQQPRDKLAQSRRARHQDAPRVKGTITSDLARLAGVGKSQLSKYESGKELPRLDSLARILFALRSSPSTLFYVVDFLNHMNCEEVKRQPLLDLAVGPLLSDTAHEAFSSMLAGLFGLFQAKADLRLLEARRRTPKGRKHDR